MSRQGSTARRAQRLARSIKRFHIPAASTFGAGAADQGIFAAGNYLLSWWMATHSSAADYGQFAFSWAVILAIGTFQNALVLEPAVVLHNSTQYSETSASIRRHDLSVTSGSGALVVVTCLLAWAILPNQRDLAVIVALAGLLAPFYLSALRERRLDYIYHTPRSALKKSLLFTTVIATIIVTHRAVPIAAALFIVSAAAYGSSRIGRRGEEYVAPSLDKGLIVRRFVRYGRWQALADILLVPAMHLQVALLPLVLPFSSVGAFRSSQLLVTPFTQVLAGLATTTLGQAVNLRDQTQRERHIARAIRISMGAAGAYSLIMLVSGPILLPLFGASGELSLNGKWWLLALQPPLAVWALASGIRLRLANVPQHYFIHGVAVGAGGIATMLLLSKMYSLTGAFVSIPAGYALSAVLLSYLRRKLIQQ